MRCPYCNHAETTVAETREHEDGDAVRRRRRCLACERRFTTYERSELEWPLVVKRDGSRVDFDPAKLRASMLLALRKRKVPADSLQAALGRIHDALLARHAAEVPSADLGELVMEELKRLDTVAFIRFASVYRQFEDVDAYRRLISEV